jgi:hypothetical protein
VINSKEVKDKEYEMDPDHALLLKQSSQLLLSSNSGVVIGVTSLYFALAPPHELSKVIRPLVTLLPLAHIITRSSNLVFSVGRCIDVIST